MKSSKIPDEVIEHWYSLVSAEQFSTQEIYADIESEVARQKVPGLVISRVDLAEGGLLSDMRQYLRMKRERLMFDICAAPVGINYFFSYRYYVEPVVVQLWEVLAVVTTILALFAGAVRYIGLFLGPTLLLVGVGVFVWLMRNAIGMGLRDLDSTLLNLPALGPIYERYFRKDTYYRQDLRIAYGSIVSGLVKQIVDEATAAKGVVLLREYRYSPVFGGLYAASERKPQPKPSAEGAPPS